MFNLIVFRNFFFIGNDFFNRKNLILIKRIPKSDCECVLKQWCFHIAFDSEVKLEFHNNFQFFAIFRVFFNSNNYFDANFTNTNSKTFHIDIKSENNTSHSAPVRAAL